MQRWHYFSSSCDVPIPSPLYSLHHKKNKNINIHYVANVKGHFSLSVLSHFNHVRLFAILRIVALQAPLSLGFSRQEHWTGLPFPSPFCSLLLLLLSRFSHVQLCATPQMAAHQAPPSLGFSRQEHWTGLPFPSPMHESEK